MISVAARAGHRGGIRLDSIEEALAAHTAELLRVAHGILRDPVAAEDAVQDALVLAWRRWDQLRDPTRRNAWLTAICVRQCLDMRRSFRRRPAVTWDQDLSNVVAPAGDRWSEWETALAGLSVKQRAVVVLHYRHGYSLDECAGLMSSRPGSARKHLARALARLRKEVRDA